MTLPGPMRTPEDARRERPAGIALEHWFVIALASGSIAIFVGEKLTSGSAWVTIGVPILVMLSYIAIGRTYLRHGTARTQYADSIYYLGFLFTLVSITAAITEFGPDVDVSRIVNRFGVKLITTLIGLGTRVYLVNFHPSAEDVAENVEESLGLAAQRMRERLDQVTHDLDALSSALTLTLKGASERISGELVATVAQASAHYRETLAVLRSETVATLGDLRGASTKALGDAGETAAAGLAGLREQIGRTTQDLGAASAELTLRLQSMGLPDDLFVTKLSPAVERLVDALEEPTKQVSALGAALGASNREIADGARNVTELAGRAADLDRELTQLGERLAQFPSLETLGSAAARVSDSLDHLGATAAESTRRLRDSNERGEEVARLLERQLALIRERAAQLDADHAQTKRLLVELQQARELAPGRPHRGLLRRIFSGRDDATRR